MEILFGVFLLTLLVLTAVAIVRTNNLFVAVMLTGIFSLLMATNFFVLDAADVTLTEAARPAFTIERYGIVIHGPRSATSSDS